METITRRFCQLILLLTALSVLGGCTVYGTTPAYYYDDGMSYGPPPRVYADPWYVGPPVFFNFGYRSGGGHDHSHGDWRNHDFRGGGDHGDRGGGHQRGR